MIAHKHDSTQGLGGKRVRMAAFLMTVALTALLVTGSATPRTTYIFTDGGLITTVEGYAGDLDAALERAGIELDAADRMTAVQEEDRVTRVEIARPVTRYEETLVEALPFEQLRRADPDLPYGQERVVQAGAAGAVVNRVKVVTDPDGAVHRTDLGSSLSRQPVSEIVAYGTKVPAVPASRLSVSAEVLTNVNPSPEGGGVITTASGQAYSYTQVLTMRATAYTTERQAWKKTATGTMARVGAIAVDPKVIPYGTRMYIVSSDGSITYGVATAEDCGGGIKGNRIDLFFDTYDACIQFGVRDCTVYLLDA